MAKTVKLATIWAVTAGVLSVAVEARALDATKDAAPLGSFKHSVDLNGVVPGFAQLNEVGQEALSFGLFTALRNSTGSCEDLAEAEAAIKARSDAWIAGEWGASRESSSVPFTANHLLCKAVEIASKGQQTAAQAAERLNDMVNAGLAAGGIPSFSGMEQPERNKARKSCVDQVLKGKPTIAAAYAKLEAERAAAALAKKAEAAEKAAAQDGGDDGGIL